MNTDDSKTLQRIENLLERVTTALERIADSGTALQAPPAVSTGQPTFCGFICAWAYDAQGFPSYVRASDGKIANRRQKQGATWFSWKIDDDTYSDKVLVFQPGETVPPIVWPGERQTTPQAAAAADDDQPASEETLRELHQRGRANHGEEWRTSGPDMILAHTDGRTRVSAEMTAGEVERTALDARRDARVPPGQLRRLTANAPISQGACVRG